MTSPFPPASTSPARSIARVQVCVGVCCSIIPPSLPGQTNPLASAPPRVTDSSNQASSAAVNVAEIGTVLDRRPLVGPS